MCFLLISCSNKQEGVPSLEVLQEYRDEIDRLNSEISRLETYADSLRIENDNKERIIQEIRQYFN